MKKILKKKETSGKNPKLEDYWEDPTLMDIVATLRTLNKMLGRKNFEKAVRYIAQQFFFQAYRKVPHNGIKVLKASWDCLIVLTSCRYDYFKGTYKDYLPGKLEKRISPGSCTLEWLKKNFNDFHDIVYVSANPRISDTEFAGFRGTEYFSEVINPWSGWDEDLNTVPPEEVTDAALEAKEEHPDKRMIVHYMQPHAPWIGETRIAGKELGLSFESPIDWYKKNAEIGSGLWGIWERALDCNIGLDNVRRAYQDNLKMVLNEVERLIRGLDGRIVVSSDHGECLGERLLIEHPGGIYVRELVEVPWLIIEKLEK